VFRKRNGEPSRFLLSGYSKSALIGHFESVAKRAVRRILEQYPKTVAVGVDGSVGRKDPSPYSDIDITALAASRKCPDPIHYVDEGCYVGILFLPLHEKKRRRIDFFWAKGGAETTRPYTTRKAF